MSKFDSQSVAGLLRESAGSFLLAQHAPARLRGWIGKARTVDATLWKGIADLGWTGLLLPEELGGSGLGIAEAAELASLLGEKLFAEPFVACTVMPAVLLDAASRQTAANAATEALAGWLASGERVLTLAWQEQADQLEPDVLACRLDGGRLTGEKRFVPAAQADGVLLVFAQEDGEPVLVAVAGDAPGVRLERHAAGVGAQADVRFEDAPLLFPEPLLRGAAASEALDRALAAGRLAGAAELAGIATGCLHLTLEYVGQRVQFGRAIGSFQSVQHRCADLYIETQLADASWRTALSLWQDDPQADTTRRAISAAKARASEAAVAAGKLGVQLHGAMGFAEEVDVGLYLRAALQGAAWLGGANAHRRRFAALHAGPAQVHGELPEPAAWSASNDPREWSDDEFRARLRAFIAAHYPDRWRQDERRPFLRLRGDDLTSWLRLLQAHGWRAPDWPRESGGMGISFRKQIIYQEEMEFAGVARIIDNGETQLGPTLMKWGTPEQRDHYLPRILDCSDIWCQGYSEPGAGSDLASLRTQAVRDGDDFIVNGQKIWTTHATDGTHIFTLVRTGQYEKKQQGISFLLIDLKSPGITIRPIANIAGEDEFCEVFFADVRVPAANLVGELDQGWSVAKALLGHERIWLGNPAMAGRALDLAEKIVAARGIAADRGIADRLARLQADLHDYRQLYARICDAVAAGHGQPGPEASALKVYVGELLQRITEFNAEVAAEYGGIVGDVRIDGLETDLHWPLMMARPVSIYAGTNEVQRDILAKLVLKLPSAPSAR
jgi:alkylation response protein AidB-like acyl-CoA dehydrogenase